MGTLMPSTRRIVGVLMVQIDSQSQRNALDLDGVEPSEPVNTFPVVALVDCFHGVIGILIGDIHPMVVQPLVEVLVCDLHVFGSNVIVQVPVPLMLLASGYEARRVGGCVVPDMTCPGSFPEP